MDREASPPRQPQPPAATTTTTTALAPGFRFHPTDEELVSYYLKRKVCGKSFRFNAISDVDIYKSEPWDLPGKAGLKSRDQEWYFFSALDRKYGNGARMNRATGKGYWKATGKDRTVSHNSRTLGMKKTLVFHNGRAPDGKRTDWVMHEYRLVDEELEKPGVMQYAYVLCRVFQKNGLGPPNGNRYAPFVEEEWDDGGSALVPGEEAGDEMVAGDDAFLEGNNLQLDSESTRNPPRGGNELPTDSQNVLPVKNERLDDSPFPCVVNREEPFPILHYKRRRHNEDSNNSNASENSSGTTNQDHCSSTTTTATTTTTMTTTSANLPSTLLELSLTESDHVPGSDAAKVGAPYCCVKFINNLQNKIHKISIERETLKLEMMSAQVLINILQSRIEYLSNENDELRNRSGRDA